jgi:hypothetical protein
MKTDSDDLLLNSDSFMPEDDFLLDKNRVLNEFK